MKKLNSGTCPGHDYKKDPKWTIGFMTLFLVGDGFLTSKSILRSDLKNMRYIKHIKKCEIEPMIKLAWGNNQDFYNIAIDDLMPCILVQNLKNGEYLLIHKDCYWW